VPLATIRDSAGDRRADRASETDAGCERIAVKLDLTEDELAFYDALEVNDSAVKVLGEPTLVKIARELVETVKRNVTIDWTVRETVRAQLRVVVKRILRKYGYPPDKQERARRQSLGRRRFCWKRGQAVT
jgi:Domain of unknown function (DUF3387)